MTQQHTPTPCRKDFLRAGSEGKIYKYSPFGEVYEIEGEFVMDCHVYKHVNAGDGYGNYCGQIPMTMNTIKNQDGSHV